MARRNIVLVLFLTVVSCSSPEVQDALSTYELRSSDHRPLSPLLITEPTTLVCDEATCYTERDLVVGGANGAPADLLVLGDTQLGAVMADSLYVTRLVAAEEFTADCPRGYRREYSGVPATVTLCMLGSDQLVRVGDIWVDRYEASVWSEFPYCSTSIEGQPYGSEVDDWSTVSDYFPYHGQPERLLYACSIPGVLPSRWITWFQAVAACAASGKHLITNAEWQAAVVGTYDPPEPFDGDGTCQTGGSGPRPAGFAGRGPGERNSCVSLWGVEDMIGNLFEWVADWHSQTTDAPPTRQPAEYFYDRTRNVLAADAQGPYATLFGATPIRGGDWDDGAEAGAFSMNLANSPAHSGPAVGFRCARGF